MGVYWCRMGMNRDVVLYYVVVSASLDYYVPTYYVCIHSYVVSLTVKFI